MLPQQGRLTHLKCFLQVGGAAEHSLEKADKSVQTQKGRPQQGFRHLLYGICLAQSQSSQDFTASCSCQCHRRKHLAEESNYPTPLAPWSGFPTSSTAAPPALPRPVPHTSASRDLQWFLGGNSLTNCARWNVLEHKTPNWCQGTKSL